MTAASPTPPSPALRLLQRIRRFEDLLIALLLGAMIGLAGLQIALRNLFDTGIAWADPALRVGVLWLALLGAVAAGRDNLHIRVDVLTRFLTPVLRRWARRLSDAFAAAVCGLLAWHSGRLVLFEWQDGTTLFGAVPAWACELIMPLGFALLALRFTLQLFAPRGDDGQPV